MTAPLDAAYTAVAAKPLWPTTEPLMTIELPAPSSGDKALAAISTPRTLVSKV